MCETCKSTDMKESLYMTSRHKFNDIFFKVDLLKGWCAKCE